jgi:hypothetical protein
LIVLHQQQQEQQMQYDDQHEQRQQRPDSLRRRVLSVRTTDKMHKVVRTIGAQHDMSNGAVIEWAITLLKRYADAGGER